MLPPPPTSTLFPYTTLFRSRRDAAHAAEVRHRQQKHELAAPEPQVKADPEAPDQSELLKNSKDRSEEHTSELQSRRDLVCRLLLEKKKKKKKRKKVTKKELK